MHAAVYLRNEPVRIKMESKLLGTCIHLPHPSQHHLPVSPASSTSCSSALKFSLLHPVPLVYLPASSPSPTWHAAAS